MNIKLRPATADDIPGILATHVAAIRELCAEDYSDKQLLAWSGLTAGGYLPAIKAHVFLVAERDAQIVGFAEFDPAGGEIIAVYVHPPHSRLGLGTTLFQALETRARAAGIRELVLHSSLTAVPFFERFGFVGAPPVSRRLADGTELLVVPMQRTY